MTRTRTGAITPTSADTGFRRIRDAINALREATQDVADLAGIEIGAWKAKTVKMRPLVGKPERHTSIRSGGARSHGGPARQPMNPVKAVITRKLHRGEDVPQATLVKNGLI